MRQRPRACSTGRMPGTCTRRSPAVNRAGPLRQEVHPPIEPVAARPSELSARSAARSGRRRHGRGVGRSRGGTRLQMGGRRAGRRRTTTHDAAQPTRVAPAGDCHVAAGGQSSAHADRCSRQGGGQQRSAHADRCSRQGGGHSSARFRALPHPDKAETVSATYCICFSAKCLKPILLGGGNKPTTMESHCLNGPGGLPTSLGHRPTLGQYQP